MADERFDEAVDVGMSAEVTSLLAVPVLSGRDVFIGVLLMINKSDGSQFGEFDQQSLLAIASFAGVAIQNVRTLEFAARLTQLLDDFLYRKPDPVIMHASDPDFVQIVKAGHSELRALRTTLFLHKDDRFLIDLNYGAVPDDTPKSVPAAQQKIVTLVSAGVGGDGQEQQHTTPRADEQDDQPKPMTKLSLVTCDFMIANDEESVALLEFAVPSAASPEDITLLETAVMIIGGALEKHCFMKLFDRRAEQFALSEVMDETQRLAFSPPESLRGWPDDLFEPSFDMDKIPDSKLLDIGFAVVNKFGLMHDFEISAGNLYVFLTRLRDKTGALWRHSLESAVFMTSMLAKSRLDEQLKRTEVLTLVLAALCREMNAHFFGPCKNELAMDVLYSKQSVFEGYHCFEALSLVFASDLMLFHTVADYDVEEIVELLLDLILATDSQKHFVLMHEFRIASRADDFPLTEDANKLLLLKLLMKCAGVGILTRPPDIAFKGVASRCDEFFRRGPIKKEQGIVFKSSVVKNRQGIDVAKSQPIVVGRVLKPLFDVLGKLLPPLEAFAASLRENEVKWWGSPPRESAAQEDEKGEPERQPDLELGPDRLMEKD
jgi:hypothetical protein